MAKTHKGKIVLAKAIKRKRGYLYFLDGQGNVREEEDGAPDSPAREEGSSGGLPMRVQPEARLEFPEGVVPARCEACARDGELVLAVTNRGLFRPKVLVLMSRGRRITEGPLRVQDIFVGLAPQMATPAGVGAPVFADDDLGVTYADVGEGIE